MRSTTEGRRRLGDLDFNLPEPEPLSEDMVDAFADAGESPIDDLMNEVLNEPDDTLHDDPRLTLYPLLAQYDFVATTTPPPSLLSGCHKHASVLVDGLTTSTAGSASLDLVVSITNADNGQLGNNACTTVAVNVHATLTTETGVRSQVPETLRLTLPQGTGTQRMSLRLAPVAESTMVDGFSVTAVSCELCGKTTPTWTDEQCAEALSYDGPRLLSESNRLITNRGTIWEAIDDVRALKRELDRDTAYARSDFVLMATKIKLATSIIQALVPVSPNRVYRSIKLGKDLGGSIERAIDQGLEAEAIARNTLVALKYAQGWSQALADTAADVSGIIGIIDDMKNVDAVHALRREVHQQFIKLDQSIRRYEAELAATEPDFGAIRQQLDEILRECRG